MCVLTREKYSSSDDSLCILEEADEDDDPEYNFLDDLDEPDLEDYRNDRAVRITSGFL